MKEKHLTLGILAHVDAGKTTLCEGLLFNTGVINKFGRVDKKESFLDYNPLERKRGITIFSKVAIIKSHRNNDTITLLDTPGHVDFVHETLSCMEIMDAALLVLDATKSISSHAKRLIALLKKRSIPIFIFANKTDLFTDSNEKERLLKEINSLGLLGVDFSLNGPEFFEQISLSSEELLEEYLENGTLKDENITNSIKQCNLSPIVFGSAINNDGIDTLLDILPKYLSQKSTKKTGFYPIKVHRDEKGNRLCTGRLFSGELRVKGLISDEKIEEIRLYNGEKYENIECCKEGMVVALRGPAKLSCDFNIKGVFEPLTEYALQGPALSDPVLVYQKLRELNEELPYLNIRLDNNRNQILLSPMGDIQLEILRDLIEERFHIDVSFERAGVIYSETIEEPVLGFGHFEPLRHYAEVHLLIEPNPENGIEVLSEAKTDDLDIVWQNQIISALKNTALRGIGLGARLKDVKITLLSGRAHEKHTESGDFREAALRALRQGLMKATPVILEPLYAFTLSVPKDTLGKVLGRLETMEANFSAPEYTDEVATVSGTFPGELLSDFPSFYASISSGHGDLSLEFGGYIPTQKSEEILALSDYDPEHDLEFPSGSVFTSHGGSIIIPWDEAENHMHLPLESLSGENTPQEELKLLEPKDSFEGHFIEPEEIDAILGLAGGSNKRRTKSDRRSHWNRYKKTVSDSISKTTYRPAKPNKPAEPKDDYLLIDGYNIIFAWDFLKELSKDNIDSARDLLIDILSEYAAYTKTIVILVFDAYKVAGGKGSVYKEKGIDIVFTKESQTADAYIEKTSHEIARKHNVTVATSDRLEQIIVRGEGAIAMSALGLLEEIKRTRKEIRDLL